jgi:Chlorophyll A-B binding protein
VLEDASQERFDRLRFLEIKHGRICMMAVAGYLATASGLRFPGDLAIGGPAFADIPSGIEAFKYVPGAGVIQILAFIGVLEMCMRDVTGKNEFVGDWRNGMFTEYGGWEALSAEAKRKTRAKELNNGRAAMMGITGLVLHEIIGNPLIPLN